MTVSVWLEFEAVVVTFSGVVVDVGLNEVVVDLFVIVVVVGCCTFVAVLVSTEVVTVVKGVVEADIGNVTACLFLLVLSDSGGMHFLFNVALVSLVLVVLRVLALVVVLIEVVLEVVIVVLALVLVVVVLVLNVIVLVLEVVVLVDIGLGISLHVVFPVQI